jgi:hypothetical protein
MDQRDFNLLAAENGRMQERINKQSHIVDNLRAILGSMTKKRNKVA